MYIIIQEDGLKKTDQSQVFAASLLLKLLAHILLDRVYIHTTLLLTFEHVSSTSCCGS